MTPSASDSTTGRRVLTPACCSQSALQAARSRPLVDLELAQEVAQLGVAPGVGLEVAPQALHELLAPDVGDELLQHRRPLGVGDPVEVDLDVLEVTDRGDDRVRRAELVLPIGPRLLGRVEGRPAPRPAGRLDLGDRAGPLGERLVEPEVVPPAHRHQVAEPHVGELVQDRQRPALDDRLGHVGPEDVGLQEGHRAGVLHRPGVELGHEQLVVLRERVGQVEHLLEERRSPGVVIWTISSVSRCSARLARQ